MELKSIVYFLDVHHYLKNFNKIQILLKNQANFIFERKNLSLLGENQKLEKNKKDSEINNIMNQI